MDTVSQMGAKINEMANREAKSKEIFQYLNETLKTCVKQIEQFIDEPEQVDGSPENTACLNGSGEVVGRYHAIRYRFIQCSDIFLMRPVFYS